MKMTTVPEQVTFEQRCPAVGTVWQSTDGYWVKVLAPGMAWWVRDPQGNALPEASAVYAWPWSTQGKNAFPMYEIINHISKDLLA
jgi:hypothetical protein